MCNLAKVTNLAMTAEFEPNQCDIRLHALNHNANP